MPIKGEPLLNYWMKQIKQENQIEETIIVTNDLLYSILFIYQLVMINLNHGPKLTHSHLIILSQIIQQRMKIDLAQ